MDFTAEAEAWRSELRDRMMPYWLGSTVDPLGGYALSDDAVKGRTAPVEKQLVTQARMVWGFSYWHRMEGGAGYREAARHGVEFLRTRMRDAQHGGYFFSVNPDGTPRDPRKLIYGQAFVIYALVEWFRASGERAALVDAMGLFHEIRRRAHDGRNRGWVEHFERDWTPLPARAPNAIVEVAGLKSANTHLHVLEAFSELYRETRDAEVRRDLEEALELNQRSFYPLDASRAAFHFQPDWGRVTDPSSAGLSYGHNVEFAWLMIRAEEALGRRPSWRHFHSHLGHALRFGTDPVRGGLYNRGVGSSPANDTSKVWWAQAEFIAALVEGLRDRPADTGYAAALRRVLEFMRRHGTDPKTGIWYDTVTADGMPKSTGLAHSWKANYHDVRGLGRFVERFGERPKKARM
jgi:mannobiose 2-epimerase